MDPLWVLVLLIGSTSLCVAGAFILMAVKIADVAGQVAPRVAEMQKQLTAASAEIPRVSEAVRSGEAQFDRLADRASIASGRVAKVVDVVPHVSFTRSATQR